ncbi:hypothetical protein ABZV24_06690 [Streptomyces sp. NPDC005251]|uniref:hypothetical protein n=1 Tax=Streptomyces sp. NPDC005251 TaxID=3157166 RepID=UPI0033B41790
MSAGGRGHELMGGAAATRPGADVATSPLAAAVGAGPWAEAAASPQAGIAVSL